MHYVHSVDESKALNDRKGPCLIISASGMAETGRVLHHLRNSIGDPNNAVLLVGYQAEQTLGRRLQEQPPAVRIFGEDVALRCPVFFMEAFSGHADRDDLFAFAAGFRKPKPARLILVHGEPEQQQPLAERLRGEGGYTRVDLPQRGDTIELK
jgi:metallo-beta-lactamase family protein